ncbi:MAG: hypothetical protein GVY16_02290 [Planctomycetes bacterium]|nr:hypothetical protein [Planctomycetota bacterium]
MLTLALIGLGCEGLSARPASSPVHSYQVIEGFSNPTAVAFSHDNKYLYVTSAPSLCIEESGYGERNVVQSGWRGISRLRIDRNQTAALDEREFITGIEATGLAVLPKPTDKLPAGTILGVAGSKLVAWSADGTCLEMTDGIAGKRAMAEVQCDADGNVYVTLADEAMLMHILHGALDAVLAGDDEGMSSTPLPAAANAIAVNNGRVYIAVDDESPISGITGVYSIPTSDVTEAEPAPVIRGLGTINGLAFTPAGTMIMARPQSNDLFLLDADGRAGRNLPLGFPLKNPQQLALHVLSDGSSLLAVPQHGTTEADGVVLVLHLPAGF